MVTINLMHGDCLDRLKDLDDNSVDSIVTDPPYGLSKEPDMIEVLKHWMNGDDYVHNSKGFMGKDWDSFVPGPSVWKECLRVLKPGGHMIAFFGTRTYDMGVLSIRIAGFEIRDQLAWAFSTGFPKSLNISKAIDKAAGAEREVVGEKKGQGNIPNDRGKWGLKPNVPVQITVPATDEANQWDGWGTALKPAYEPIVLARKPLEEKTVAANVLKWGTGGINIDESRVPINPEIDDPRLGGNGSWKTENAAKNVYEGGYAGKEVSSSPLGRFPSNLIHDGSPEVVSLFPESKGQQGDVKGTEPSHTGQNGIYNEYGRVESQKRGDSGSAARFFYCAKASKSDRNEGLDDFEEKSIGGKGNGIRRICATCGTSALEAHLCECEEKNWINPATKKNNHPTVKPTDLMKYLVTLVTPPNGTVLDPFMGSGSTGKAAVRCGFNFIGIELDSDYLDIAKARIEYARDNPEEIKTTKKKENNTDIKKDLPNDLFE